MSALGPVSFGFFLVLIIFTAAVFSLPQSYGWSWGLAVQLWAVFGLVQLYRLSDPRGGEEVGSSLPARLAGSLFRARQVEGAQAGHRLGRFDALMFIASGAAFIMWIGAVSIMHGASGGDMALTAYAFLYLAAQVFCLGVIAFLAQLFAVRPRYVVMGAALCACIACSALLYTLIRYGFVWPVDSGPHPRGAMVYLSPSFYQSAFGLRLQAFGWIGAALPWMALAPMGLTLIRMARDPLRRTLIALMGLGVVGVLGFYDLFALRAGGHYFMVWPGFAALCLCWGRAGYGTGPGALADAARTSRYLADFQ